MDRRSFWAVALGILALLVIGFLSPAWVWTLGGVAVTLIFWGYLHERLPLGAARRVLNWSFGTVIILGLASTVGIGVWRAWVAPQTELTRVALARRALDADLRVATATEPHMFSSRRAALEHVKVLEESMANDHALRLGLIERRRQLRQISDKEAWAETQAELARVKTNELHGKDAAATLVSGASTPSPEWSTPAKLGLLGGGLLAFLLVLGLLSKGVPKLGFARWATGLAAFLLIVGALVLWVFPEAARASGGISFPTLKAVTVPIYTSTGTVGSLPICEGAEDHDFSDVKEVVGAIRWTPRSYCYGDRLTVPDSWRGYEIDTDPPGLGGKALVEGLGERVWLPGGDAYWDSTRLRTLRLAGDHVFVVRPVQ